MNKPQQRFMSHMVSIDRIKVPKTERLLSRFLAIFITLTLVILWFTPWIQSAHGIGEVSALSPAQRTQAISALVPGQIKTWHVREGDRVKKGDPIVTLIDTDEELIGRLEAQITAMEQQQRANQTALSTAENDLRRRQTLYEQGLASKRDVEQVQIRLEDLKATVASTTAELNKAKVSLARQSIQTKKAPSDGVILRLLSAGNATFVNSGDILASFIPDGVDRSVVIQVTGLDAPLVYPGRKVRLQFDGWPVFQFSGWPSVAIGTFAGEVEFVEPIAQQSGQFNVWIKEDPESEIPWPGERYARLGSRVKAWILLDEVRLGYELWRQLNNFPPENRNLDEDNPTDAK